MCVCGVSVCCIFLILLSFAPSRETLLRMTLKGTNGNSSATESMQSQTPIEVAIDSVLMPCILSRLLVELSRFMFSSFSQFETYENQRWYPALGECGAFKGLWIGRLAPQLLLIRMEKQADSGR